MCKEDATILHCEIVSLCDERASSRANMLQALYSNIKAKHRSFDQVDRYKQNNTPTKQHKYR